MFKTIAPAMNFVKRNERRILITTTVVSTTAAVVMRSGIAQHNEFLRERGLFDEFYNLTES
jgi:hypothetical protein